uniref:Uncharacterized protein n=1 Tax=viral metagenome TaxID=1070528 RepID=A0A6H2A1J0_9ZZZZ
MNKATIIFVGIALTVQPDPEKRPKLVYGYMGPGLTKEELNRIKAIEFDGNKDSLR